MCPSIEISAIGVSQVRKLQSILIQLNVSATSAVTFSDELWAHVLTRDPSIGFILTSTIRSALSEYVDTEQIEIARRYCTANHLPPQVMTAA